MVFGNRDHHSGSGVAFSRNPNTGEQALRRGPVRSPGRRRRLGPILTRPLHELADREPAVWAGLLDALHRVEDHYRDACHLEFTFEAGAPWLLQVRPGRFAGDAAVRVATDLADEGVIGRGEALLRVSPRQLQHVRIPRIATVDEADVLARGSGACPGVAVGRVATTADNAARMAADGPVILVRPATSCSTCTAGRRRRRRHRPWRAGQPRRRGRAGDGQTGRRGDRRPHRRRRRRHGARRRADRPRRHPHRHRRDRWGGRRRQPPHRHDRRRSAPAPTARMGRRGLGGTPDRPEAERLAAAQAVLGHR